MMADVERQINGSFRFVGGSALNDESPFLKRCFRPLFILLRFVGLYLPNCRSSADNRKNSPSFCTTLRLLFIIAVFLLSVYRIVNLAMQISVRRLDLSSTMILVMFSWSLQSCISILFVSYWQYYGYLDDYFNLLHWPQSSIGCKKNRRRICARFAICLAFCLLGLFCSLTISLMGFLSSGADIAVNESIYYMFGSRNLYWIGTIELGWDFSLVVIDTFCIVRSKRESVRMNFKRCRISRRKPLNA